MAAEVFEGTITDLYIAPKKAEALKKREERVNKGRKMQAKKGREDGEANRVLHPWRRRSRRHRGARDRRVRRTSASPSSRLAPRSTPQQLACKETAGGSPSTVSASQLHSLSRGPRSGGAARQSRSAAIRRQQVGRGLPPTATTCGCLPLRSGYEPEANFSQRAAASAEPGLDEALGRAAIDYHRYPQPGKITVMPTKDMTTQRDLALAYSPGVAAPASRSRTIREASTTPPRQPGRRHLPTARPCSVLATSAPWPASR